MKRYPRSCTIALLYDMLVEIPPLGLSKERPLMNVLFSSMEYDFHSLVTFCLKRAPSMPPK